MLEKAWVALETICRNKVVKDDSCEDSGLHTERMPRGNRDQEDCDTAVAKGFLGLLAGRRKERSSLKGSLERAWLTLLYF